MISGLLYIDIFVANGLRLFDGIGGRGLGRSRIDNIMEVVDGLDVNWSFVIALSFGSTQDGRRDCVRNHLLAKLC